MELREVICLLPVIYVDIEHLKRDKDDKIINWPPFPCWISCKFYTWDRDAKDFIEKEAPFFFDGKEFHYTTNIYNVDGADWIFELGWPAKLI